MTDVDTPRKTAPKTDKHEIMLVQNDSAVTKGLSLAAAFAVAKRKGYIGSVAAYLYDNLKSNTSA